MNKPMAQQSRGYFGLDEAFFAGSDRVQLQTPIRAVALFCDDIRLENNGKLTMIGHYPQEFCFLPERLPLDRISVYTRASWRSSFRPTTLAVRVDMPGYEPRLHPIPRAQTERQVGDDGDLTTVHSVVHLHFIPLRPGDRIAAWLRVDDIDLPTGSLTIRPSRR